MSSTWENYKKESRIMKNTRKPAPDAHWITYAFYPWDEYTQAEIHLRSLVGGIGSALVVWRGHLPIGRRDLAGRTPADCTLMLGDELWRSLGHVVPEAHLHAPVGSGSPLGDMGGIVGQDSLPGL